MSTATTQPRENAAARMGRKQKKILLVLGVITLATWGRQFIGGGEDKPSAAATAAPAGATGAANTAANAKPRGAAVAAVKPILNFEQAQERMKLWPEALNRRVIQGPIHDLTPVAWMLGPNLSTVPLAAQQPREEFPLRQRPETAKPPIAEATPAPEPEVPVLGVLPLRLRSTAIFGAKRYAVIEGVRYAEGETVQIGDGPAAGIYMLEQVRAREVRLRQGQNAWTVVIQEPVSRSRGWDDVSAAEDKKNTAD